MESPEKKTSTTSRYAVLRTVNNLVGKKNEDYTYDIPKCRYILQLFAKKNREKVNEVQDCILNTKNNAFFVGKNCLWKNWNIYMECSAAIRDIVNYIKLIIHLQEHLKLQIKAAEEHLETVKQKESPEKKLEVQSICKQILISIEKLTSHKTNS